MRSAKIIRAIPVVVLLLAAAGCGGVLRTEEHRKPQIPALEIRPGSASLRGGTSIKFRVYLVEGAASTMIDPSDVRWSTTRERGEPGTVREGLFTAPEDANEFKCRVRAVYRSEEYAGSSSDTALVRVISETNREPTSTATRTGEDDLKQGPSSVGERIFDTSNPYAVRNGPTAPTIFSIGRSRRIVYLLTYHWNLGRGAKPGTIGVQGPGKKRYGPWRARGFAGRRGTKPNVYWAVFPNVTLPPGSYIVLDSSPETWSYNRVSGGRGMTVVEAASRDAEGKQQ